MNDVIASLMLLGAVGSGNSYLPYWMTTNQYGLMPEQSGALAVFQARRDFQSDTCFPVQFRWGTSLAANMDSSPATKDANFMVDELYASARWTKFTLDLGMKHRDLDFLGAGPSLGSLSVTGGHVAESGNARTMPGYLLTLDPVAVPLTFHRLFIYGAYGDFTTTDARYVQNALVHRTRAFVRLDITDRLSLHAGLDHYAMWAGTQPNPDEVNYKVNLSNYFRVVTGHSAGSGGAKVDQENVIGDQGGGELFKLVYSSDNWILTAQHDIPYADGSGMVFHNFPDGVNTICFSRKDKNRWISDVLYEHQYTMWQSGCINIEGWNEEKQGPAPSWGNTFGGDNYFSNGYYKSCWTHYGHLIGDPLCLPKGIKDGTWSSSIVNLGIENNRLKSHHIALSGKLFRKYPYKVMLTYSDNYGTYFTSYEGESQWNHEWGTVKEEGLKQISAAFVGSFNLLDGHIRKGKLTCVYGIFADKGSLYKDCVGAEIGLKYSLGK